MIPHKRFPIHAQDSMVTSPWGIWLIGEMEGKCAALSAHSIARPERSTEVERWKTIDVIGFVLTAATRPPVSLKETFAPNAV